MSPLVKICPSCEAANPATASFCFECDWDLMSVAPTAPAGQTAPTNADAPGIEVPSENALTMRVGDARALCTLELVENPALRFPVRDGQTIGRSGRADVELVGVPEREFLSRVHARLFRRGEQWFAQYVTQGNFIKVDGQTYEDDSEIALENGSMLSLSLTTFRVVLE